MGGFKVERECECSNGSGSTSSNLLYLGDDSVIGTSALALYQFDHTASQLNDRTTSGYNLTLETGTIKKSVLKNLKGLLFDGATKLVANGTDESLRVVGAMTIEMQIIQPACTDAWRVFLTCDQDAESLASNALYSLINQNTTEKELGTFHEYGAGSNEIHSSQIQLIEDNFYYVALTRASNGTDYEFYLNGVAVASVSASNAPQKDVAGNLQKLRIGGSDAPTEFALLNIASIRISDSELSAKNIEDIYNEISP